mmetsp:Transcript_111939/g.316365  ORF Transcript_111939/g.316365 Transcript_111939/m.316365 type:complete len:236 (+) Transcript_111939:407-1114(+)
MLRSNPIGYCHCFGHICYKHSKALAYCGDGDITRGKHRQLPFQRFVDLCYNRGLWRHKDGPCLNVVLGLRQQVRGHNLWVRCAIGDDKDFAGASQHVDPADAIDDGLSRGHPIVAGSYDDVASPDANAIRHGCYSLRSPHSKQAIRSGHVGGALGHLNGAGRCDHHLGHPCNASGASCHQHRRWQWIPAARRVASRTLHRLDGLPRDPTCDFNLHGRHSLPLGAGKSTNARGGAL